VSGKKLGDFFQENLFEPLGIRHTGFKLNAHQRGGSSGCMRVYPMVGLRRCPLKFRKSLSSK
jgi:CubicO group peptidase (beta-lactamase class C family)